MRPILNRTPQPINNLINKPKPINPLIGLGLLIVILISNAIFLHHNAFRIFKFFDMGSFIDAAWRIYHGQIPHQDYSVHVGQVHAYVMAFFFKIFGGFNKSAIIWNVISVHSAVIICTYTILRKRTLWFLALIGTLLTTSCFYWELSHPYYTKTALLWPFVAVTYYLTHLPFSKPRDVINSALICGISVVLSFLTKPNVGTAFGIAFGLTFLITLHRKQALMAYSIGIFLSGLVSIPLIIRDFSGFINQTIFGYGSGQFHRIIRLFSTTDHWLANHYWIIALIVLIYICFYRGITRDYLSMFFAVAFVAVFEMATSGSIWQSNVPLMGLLMSVAFVILCQGTPRYVIQHPKAIRITLISVLILLSAFLINRYTKFGLEVKGWTFPDRYINGYAVNPKGVYPMKTKSMEGWLVEKTQGQAVDNLAEFINNNIPENEPFMILTDLFILNALTNRKPILDTPSIFTIGLFPAPGKPVNSFKKRFVNDMPKWIVTHRGKVAFITSLISYLGLKETLEKNYAVAYETGVYVILMRLPQNLINRV